MSAPRAEKRPVTTTHFEDTRTDNYDWLRADNWQEVMRDPSLLAADIRAHLEDENTFFERQMDHTGLLQETLFNEMRGRIKEDDTSVPAPDGDWAYSIKYIDGGQHPLFVRIPRNGGPEEVLLDGNALAKDKAYFRIGGASQSPDHSHVAWAYDDNGSEKMKLRIRDVAQGVDLNDLIHETSSGGVWSGDGCYIFYVRLDESHRPSRVYRHRVGTKESDDILVYEETDPGFFVSVTKTRSNALIVISVHTHETTELHFIPADQPEQAPICIQPRQTGLEYWIDEGGGLLYILTNADGAKDFKIMTALVGSPGMDNWRDLVPAKTGRFILSSQVYAQHLVRLERVEGLPQIVIRKLDDGSEHTIAFDEEAYALGVDPGFEFATPTLRFTYSSLSTPEQVFDYDMSTRERVLRKQQEVPSGHNPEDYVTRRIMAPTDDGTLVPVSVLYHKSTPVDGTAPCLLYGYGAYGYAIPAAFSITCLSLVDRGFVYAIAHIRGGKDKGTHWYEDGKLSNKRNTFSDYIAAANHLASEKFTGKGRIVAEGGSAGGLLMGAVANLEPDLFAGVIGAVPFVDTLNTMLDDTLPLTPPEWPEWGNPIENEEDYRNIRSYSPYDNVSEQAYPPILVIAGLTDPRVTYWEPAKWAAKLRELNTGDNPILLRTNMEAGHAGAAGRFDALKETAIEQAFALWVTGLIEREEASAAA